MKKYITLEEAKKVSSLDKRKVVVMSTELHDLIGEVAKAKKRSWNEHARIVLEKDSLRELKRS